MKNLALACYPDEVPVMLDLPQLGGMGGGSTMRLLNYQITSVVTDTNSIQTFQL